MHTCGNTWPEGILFGLLSGVDCCTEFPVICATNPNWIRGNVGENFTDDGGRNGCQSNFVASTTEESLPFSNTPIHIPCSR